MITAALNSIKLDDMWMLPSAETPNVYFEYDADPLALVCSMLADEKSDLNTIYNTVYSMGPSSRSIKDAVNQQGIAYAQTIRKHFKHRLMVRRLNSKQMSKFMIALEDVLESESKLNKANISILVKLPTFYEEDRQHIQVFKDAVNVVESHKQIDEICEFVGRVDRNSASQKRTHWFLKTGDNQLVRASTNWSEMGHSAWEALYDLKKVKIVGTVVKTVTPGFDNTFFDLSINCKVSTI